MTASATAAALDSIVRTYAVPARLGGRFRYTGSRSLGPRDGRITGARGCYLAGEFDDEPGKEYFFHPRWEMEYLEGAAHERD